MMDDDEAEGKSSVNVHSGNSITKLSNDNKISIGHSTNHSIDRNDAE